MKILSVIVNVKGGRPREPQKIKTDKINIISLQIGGEGLIPSGVMNEINFTGIPADGIITNSRFE